MTESPTNRGTQFQKAFFAFIVAVLFVFILKELRHIFIPFFIALFLYFMLHEAMGKLKKWKIPKTVIGIGLLVIIFSCLFLFGLLLFTGASSFISDFPAYSTKITQIFKSMMASLNLPLLDVKQYIANIDWEKTINPTQVTTLVSGTMGDFTKFIGNLLLVLLLLMFMLGEKISMITRITKTLPKERAEELQSIVSAIETRIQHYLFIKTLMSVATATLAVLILLIGQVEFIIFSALLIFFSNFIPTFGSLIGTIFPVLMTFLRYGFSLRLVLVTASLMLMQFIMGNVFEPQIMGKNMNLSPITILLSLIFWGWVWGLVGMFLAVPITSALKIIFENIPLLKPLAAAMSRE